MGDDKSKSKIVQDYSRNALFDKERGYTSEAKYEGNEALKAAAGEPIRMMGQATMGDRVSPLDYSGNNMKLRSNINMMGDPNAMGQAQADLAYNPVDDISGQGTEGINAAAMMKKGMDKAKGY